MSPLRKARIARGWSLVVLGEKLGEAGTPIDNGNLSRIERGKQGASPKLAAAIVSVIGRKSLTELHVLYPDRYQSEEVSA